MAAGESRAAVAGTATGSVADTTPEREPPCRKCWSGSGRSFACFSRWLRLATTCAVNQILFFFGGGIRSGRYDRARRSRQARTNMSEAAAAEAAKVVGKTGGLPTRSEGRRRRTGGWIAVPTYRLSARGSSLQTNQRARNLRAYSYAGNLFCR